jgi:hypothetical protein
MRVTLKLSAIYAGAFLPVAYAAYILAVVIHEVLGHGLAAILMGGTLHRVVVRWDGLGYASTSLPAHCSAVLQMLHFAAGSLATIAVGVPVFLLGLRLATESRWKLPLVIMGALIALEGLPYLFFNSLFPRLPGDFGFVLAIWKALFPGQAAGRAIMIILGGAGTLTVMLLATGSVHNTVADRLSRGASPSLGMSIYVLGIFVILPTVLLTYTFDWDQVIEGIGHLPNHMMVASIVGCAFAVLAHQHSRCGTVSRPCR